eukprot:CAMPEP_0197924756 /NCGR_PEP_ID=MMETSP1439-20131203/96262_1 /TAXON_ID=66791 /ORGANISM="Gonyaulax spinifera, Strain CCMP409" /LENGTH=100 /DNA_ID=CAMNT_0043547203 /DNA_START=312 /DNA_END=612 /DNA_ORIENTATION=+
MVLEPQADLPRPALAPAEDGVGLELTFRAEDGRDVPQGGMSWLFSTAPIDDLNDSVRLHSEESTIVAAVCCTMERRLPSAEMAKSLSLTVARVGSDTPST